MEHPDSRHGSLMPGSSAARGECDRCSLVFPLVELHQICDRCYEELRGITRPQAPKTSLARKTAARLLTVREAATAARVTPRTIRQWIADGHLKASNMSPTGATGARYRITDLEIVRLVTARLVRSEDDH